MAWGIEDLGLPERRCAHVRAQAKGLEVMATDPGWSDATDIANLVLFHELLLGDQRVRETHVLVDEYRELADEDARRAFVERAAESLDAETCIALLGAASDRELQRALFEE